MPSFSTGKSKGNSYEIFWRVSVFFGRWRNRSLDELYREGLDALDEGRFSRAISIAKEAHRRGNSMGFELESRALWGRGDWERALEVARQGTLRFPMVAKLWGYYGEFSSNLGRYDDASAAFMRSGEGHGASAPKLVEYNLGVVAFRRGRIEEAIRYYRSAIDAPGERPDAGLLWAEQAYAHALLRQWEAAREAIARLDAAPPHEVQETLKGRMEVARAACSSVEPSQKLLDLFTRYPENAVHIFRSVEGQTSACSKWFTLYVREGRKNRWARVVAEDQAQAIEFYSRFWPAKGNRSIGVHEGGPAGDELLGVVEFGDGTK